MKTDIQPTKTPQDLIATINTTQEQLQQVKTKLGSIVDTLSQSPSTFTYITQKWHQLSFPYKVLWAALIAIPLLLIGMLAQVAVLTALGAALCLFVGISVYLLENHKNQSELNTEQLKKPIHCMIDILETIMLTLSESSILLAKEITHLQATNSEVTQRCSALAEEIKQLKDTNTILDKDLRELLALHKQLKSTLKTVDETVLEQRATLERCQKILDETMTAYKNNQQELSTKINELSSVKQSLALEVDKVQQLSETLKKTVFTFTQVTLTEEQQRTEFLEKFNSFLRNQEATLQKTTQTLIESGAQLTATTKELEGNNKRLKSLLDQQEQAVVSLVCLTQVPQTKPSEAPLLKAPITHGLFHESKLISMTNHPSTLIVYG